MGEAFKVISDLRAQLNKTIREEGKKILIQELNKTLDALPEVEAIVWAQNHSVYNDESYSFCVWGLDFVLKKDCPWYSEFIKAVCHESGFEEEDYHKQRNFWRASIYCLEDLWKACPLYADRILLIKKTIEELDISIPQEVFEIFDNVSVRADRDGLDIQDYEYDS